MPLDWMPKRWADEADSWSYANRVKSGLGTLLDAAKPIMQPEPLELPEPPRPAPAPIPEPPPIAQPEPFTPFTLPDLASVLPGLAREKEAARRAADQEATKRATNGQELAPFALPDLSTVIPGFKPSGPPGGRRGTTTDPPEGRQGAATGTPSAMPTGAPPDEPMGEIAEGDPAKFFATAGPYARAVERETGIPAALSLAVAANETGYGQRRYMAGANNYHGIQARPGEPGAVPYKDWRPGAGGQQEFYDAAQRSFADPKAGFQGFASFLLDNPRYKPALDRYRQDGDVNALAAGIHQAGYAEDPEYTRKITSIMRGIPVPTGVGEVTAPRGVGPQPTTPPQAEQTPAAQAQARGGLDVDGITAAYRGVPYVFGGAGGRSDPRLGVASDCSGFVAAVYKNQFGIDLPAHTDTSYNALRQIGAPEVAQSEARPGDVVYYMGAGTGGSITHHMGLYAGNGKVLDMASGRTDGVRVRDIGHAGQYVILRDPRVNPEQPRRAQTPPEIVPTGYAERSPTGRPTPREVDAVIAASPNAGPPAAGSPATQDAYRMPLGGEPVPLPEDASDSERYVYGGADQPPGTMPPPLRNDIPFKPITNTYGPASASPMEPLSYRQPLDDEPFDPDQGPRESGYTLPTSYNDPTADGTQQQPVPLPVAPSYNDPTDGGTVTQPMAAPEQLVTPGYAPRTQWPGGQSRVPPPDDQILAGQGAVARGIDALDTGLRSAPVQDAAASIAPMPGPVGAAASLVRDYGAASDMGPLVTTQPGDAELFMGPQPSSPTALGINPLNVMNEGETWRSRVASGAADAISRGIGQDPDRVVVGVTIAGMPVQMTVSDLLENLTDPFLGAGFSVGDMVLDEAGKVALRLVAPYVRGGLRQTIGRLVASEPVQGAVQAGREAVQQAGETVQRGTRAVGSFLEQNAQNVAAADARMAAQGSTAAPGTLGQIPEEFGRPYPDIRRDVQGVVREQLGEPSAEMLADSRYPRDAVHPDLRAEGIGPRITPQVDTSSRLNAGFGMLPDEAPPRVAPRSIEDAVEAIRTRRTDADRRALEVAAANAEQKLAQQQQIKAQMRGQPQNVVNAEIKRQGYTLTKQEEAARLGFTGQEEVAEVLREGQVIPSQVVGGMLGQFPSYLRGVTDFIVEQRQKLVNGTLTPRDVSKAYVHTVGSMQAGAQGRATLEAKLGRQIGDLFVDEGKVRPEEAIADWFFTPAGKRALDAIEGGTVDRAAWDDLLRMRDAYGNNTLRNMGVFGPKSRSTAQIDFDAPIRRRPDGTPLEYDIRNIGELTERLNAARGDTVAIMQEIAKVKGIGPAKPGFIKHLLGLGNEATFDAVEMNLWLTGKGDTGRMSGPAAEMARAAKLYSDNPEVTRLLFDQIRSRFDELRSAGVGSEIDPAVFNHIMHHWIWDKAKGLQTTHAGMYEAMRNAATLGTLPEAAGRTTDPLSAVNRVLGQAGASWASGGTGAAVGVATDPGSPQGEDESDADYAARRSREIAQRAGVGFAAGALGPLAATRGVRAGLKRAGRAVNGAEGALATFGAAPAPGNPQRAIAMGADPAQRYEFRYRVVDLGDLTPSHLSNGQPNPDFPQQLQPRARERVASQMQIDTIARGLVPDALLEDVGRLDSGPMIVGPDRIVESGNGRVLALRRAAVRYPDQYAAYTAALRERLGDYGLDESALAGTRQPVLVRERVTDVNRAAFAAEANNAGLLRMSSFEQAVQDAGNLTDDAVTGLTVGENDTIASALRKTENRGLVRQWVGTLPENERGGILDANGDLSAQGYDRLTNAMLVRTYGEGAGERLARAFIESADPTVRNVQTALMQSLPDVARAEALVRSGQRDAGLSIAEDIAAATDMLARLRREGVPVREYLGQSAMFERELTPLQESILEFLGNNQRKPSAIREALREYASRVENTADPNQVDMFGGQMAGPTREDLWRGATAGSGVDVPDAPLLRAAEENPPAGRAPADGAGLEATPAAAIPEPPARPAPRAQAVARPGPVPEGIAPTGGPAGTLAVEGAPAQLAAPTQSPRGTLPVGGPQGTLAQQGAPAPLAPPTQAPRGTLPTGGPTAQPLPIAPSLGQASTPQGVLGTAPATPGFASPAAPTRFPNGAAALAAAQPAIGATPSPRSPTSGIPKMEAFRRWIVRQATDRRVDVNEMQREAQRILGRPLEADEMVSEQMRANPTGAAKVAIDSEVRPVLQALAPEDRTTLSTLMSLLSDADAATATGAASARIGPGGLTPADAKQAAAHLWSTLTPEAQQAVDTAGDALYGTLGRYRDALVKAGIWTQDQADQIAQNAPHWIPTQALDYAGAEMASPTGRGSLSLRSRGLATRVTQDLSGPREDPLASVVRFIQDAEARLQQNEVFNAFANLRDRVPGWDQMIPEVPSGTPAAKGRGERTVTGFDPTTGERRTFLVPAPMAAAVRLEQGQQFPPVIRAATTLFRELVTRMPAFVAAQVPMDFLGALARESAREGGPQHAPRVALELVKGYADAWKGIMSGEFQGDTARYLREGGAMAGFYNRSVDASKQTIDDLTRRHMFEVRNGDDRKKLATWLLTGGWSQAAGARLEMGPRVAGFRLGEQRSLKAGASAGKAALEGMVEGRTTGPDFDQGGVAAKLLNQIIPFFNVGAQSAATLPRMLKENPAAAATTLFTLVAAPTAAAEAWNRLDSQRSRDYDDVPDYVKDRGIVIMLPGVQGIGERGERRPNYALIPTRDLSPIVLLTREAIQRGMGTSQRSVQDAARSLLGMASPVQATGAADLATAPLPPILSTIAQLGADQDFFRGGPIKTESRDDRASALAKGVAGATGRRPSQVDFAIRDAGAGLGAAASAASDLVTGREQKSSRIQNTPVVGSVISRFVGDQGGGNLTRAQEAMMTPALESAVRQAGMYPDQVTPVSGRRQNAPLRPDEQERWQRAYNAAIPTALAQARASSEWANPQTRKQAIQSALEKAKDQSFSRALPGLTEGELQRRAAKR